MLRRSLTSTLMLASRIPLAKSCGATVLRRTFQSSAVVLDSVKKGLDPSAAKSTGSKSVSTSGPTDKPPSTNVDVGKGSGDYAEFKGPFPTILGKHSRLVLAAFAKAAKARNVELVERDMNTLLNLGIVTPNFFKTLYQPTLTMEANVKHARELSIKLCFAPETAELFILLTSQKNTHLLPKVARSMLDVIRAARGEMSISVVSAEPLGPEQKSKITAVFDAISKTRNKKSVAIEYKVEPLIIGGLRIFIDGSEFYDFSVARDIDSFEERNRS